MGEATPTALGQRQDRGPHLTPNSAPDLPSSADGLWDRPPGLCTCWPPVWRSRPLHRPCSFSPGPLLPPSTGVTALSVPFPHSPRRPTKTGVPRAVALPAAMRSVDMGTPAQTTAPPNSRPGTQPLCASVSRICEKGTIPVPPHRAADTGPREKWVTPALAYLPLGGPSHLEAPGQQEHPLLEVSALCGCPWGGQCLDSGHSGHTRCRLHGPGRPTAGSIQQQRGRRDRKGGGRVTPRRSEPTSGGQGRWRPPPGAGPVWTAALRAARLPPGRMPGSTRTCRAP